MQWLSQKKVKISKDFKRECEYEWQHDDQKKMLHVKSDDEGCETYEKIEDNVMINENRLISQIQHASENYAVTMGASSKVI